LVRAPGRAALTEYLPRVFDRAFLNPRPEGLNA
jgi:hypothetical protein